MAVRGSSVCNAEINESSKSHTTRSGWKTMPVVFLIFRLITFSISRYCPTCFPVITHQCHCKHQWNNPVVNHTMNRNKLHIRGRACCKDDSTSHWESSEYDPQQLTKPLKRLSASITSAVPFTCVMCSNSDKRFLPALYTKLTHLSYPGLHPSPLHLDRFWHEIYQRTRVRVRECFCGFLLFGGGEVSQFHMPKPVSGSQ